MKTINKWLLALLILSIIALITISILFVYAQNKIKEILKVVIFQDNVEQTDEFGYWFALDTEGILSSGEVHISNDNVKSKNDVKDDYFLYGKSLNWPEEDSLIECAEMIRSISIEKSDSNALIENSGWRIVLFYEGKVYQSYYGLNQASNVSELLTRMADIVIDLSNFQLDLK